MPRCTFPFLPSCRSFILQPISNPKDLRLTDPNPADPSYSETAGVSSASFTLELEGGKLYILQVLDESYSENAKDTTVTITIN